MYGTQNTDLDASITDTAVWAARWTIELASSAPLHTYSQPIHVNRTIQRWMGVGITYLILVSCMQYQYYQQLITQPTLQVHQNFSSITITIITTGWPLMAKRQPIRLHQKSTFSRNVVRQRRIIQCAHAQEAPPHWRQHQTEGKRENWH